MGWRKKMGAGSGFEFPCWQNTLELELNKKYSAKIAVYECLFFGWNAAVASDMRHLFDARFNIEFRYPLIKEVESDTQILVDKILSTFKFLKQLITY